MTSAYTVTAVKKIRGHDGDGSAYQCDLQRNGKVIAQCLDDGWGGGLQIRYLDKNPAVVNFLDYQDKPMTRNGTAEEAAFEAYVMALPKVLVEDSEMSTNADIVIDDMVNDEIAIKAIKADLKKKITAKADGKLLTWKITPAHTDAILRAHVLNKYPGALIINDMAIPEILTLYRAEKVIA